MNNTPGTTTFIRTFFITALHLWVLLLSNFQSRSQVAVAGRVTDTANKPLAFTSVILFKDSALVKGISADEFGKFVLQLDGSSNHTYEVRFSLIGYLSQHIRFVYPDTMGLGHVVLQPDKSVLSGITVSARRPVIIRKTDRFIVDVANSFLGEGHTGWEVLQKSPGVWVDNNGNILLKGKQSAMVMINDVVQHMTAEELADYLRTLHSEDISSIEIITNPPAEFEAAGAGGIIHIKLKKSRKDGLHGLVTSQYRYQDQKPLFSSGTSLNYKYRHLVLSGNYTYNYEERNITEAAEITHPGKSYYTNYTKRTESINNYRYRAGLTWDFNNRHAAGVQWHYMHTNFDPDFYSQVAFGNYMDTTTGIISTRKRRNYGAGSATFNYIWKTDTIGSMFKIIADYTYNRKKEPNYFVEDYSDTLQNRRYRVNNLFETDIYTVQADYTKMFSKKSVLKSGIKYAAIDRDNATMRDDLAADEWIPNPGQTDHFIYSESLLMGYASFEQVFSDHLTIKAGVRGEETYSRGNSLSTGQQFNRNYFGLFPSVFILYTTNPEKENAFYLNYSRRLSRPSLSDLNPFRVQFSNYTALKGNPNLEPQYTHNMEAGYYFLHDYTANVYFTRTLNEITLSANPGIDNSIDYNTENVNTSDEYGVSVNAPVQLAKWWSTMNAFSVYQLSYTFNQQKNRQTSFTVRTIHTITAGNFCNIDLAVSYRSPYKYTNLYTYETFSTDLGFAKKLFQKKLNLRIAFTDLFNTVREKEWTDENHTTILFYRKRPSRTAGITLTWNFSTGKKFRNRDIEQANSEEKGRIGN